MTKKLSDIFKTIEQKSKIALKKRDIVKNILNEATQQPTITNGQQKLIKYFLGNS